MPHKWYVSTLSQDLIRWAIFVFSSTSCLTLQGLRILLKLIVGWIQLLPCWAFLSFWPCLYILLLTDPKSWTLLQIIQDLRYQASTPHSRAKISHSTWRQYIARGKVKIIPTTLRHGVNSNYESHGAYANLGSSLNESAAVFALSAKSLFYDEPLWLPVPYKYFAVVAREPPDNAFCQILAFMGIILIFSSVLFSAALHIHRHAVTSCKILSRFSPIFLATSEIQEGTNFFFSFDSDGLLFVINNSATCIICNDWTQFVGDLWAERSSVETTRSSASTDYVGTISLTITTNKGDLMQYHIPNAIYDPNSPLKILGFLSLESSWGEMMPLIQLAMMMGPTYNLLHHTPVLSRIVILCTMIDASIQAFCSRMKQSYDNAVHFFLFFGAFDYFKWRFHSASLSRGSSSSSYPGYEFRVRVRCSLYWWER